MGHSKRRNWPRNVLSTISVLHSNIGTTRKRLLRGNIRWRQGPTWAYVKHRCFMLSTHNETMVAGPSFEHSASCGSNRGLLLHRYHLLKYISSSLTPLLSPKYFYRYSFKNMAIFTRKKQYALFFVICVSETLKCAVKNYISTIFCFHEVGTSLQLWFPVFLQIQANFIFWVGHFKSVKLVKVICWMNPRWLSVDDDYT